MIMVHRVLDTLPAPSCHSISTRPVKGARIFFLASRSGSADMTEDMYAPPGASTPYVVLFGFSICAVKPTGGRFASGFHRILQFLFACILLY